MNDLPTTSTAPLLSPELIDTYKRVLSGPEPLATDPSYAHWHRTKAIYDQAMQVTGQPLAPAADPRSPQAAQYDRSHALGMMEPVRANILADLASTAPPDMAATARAIQAVGQDYLEQISLARIAFNHAGIKGDPERLGPVALRQAAETGRHIKREMPGRPA
jgi:hypothetical protein